MDKIKLSSLLHDARTLERFAYRYPERNRVFGGRAHTDTVNWLYNELRATKYYNVEVQEQVHTWTLADQKLEVAEEKVVVWPMTYSPPGDTKGKVLLVPNGGCTTVCNAICPTSP
jgi:carboxypeptidase Q